MNAREVKTSISPSDVMRLRLLAKEGSPEEVCGVIYNDGRIVQYDNVSCDDREHSFDMEVDVAEGIRAVWHSHPVGPPHLSVDDLLCANHVANMGYDISWIIVMLHDVFEYRISPAAKRERVS